MTSEERKEEKIKELLKLAEDNTALVPPCYNDKVLELFNKFFHLWLDGDMEHFSEYMNNNYTALSAKDIAKLEGYLAEARKYLIDICCIFAGIYQSYGGIRYNYGVDQKYCDILIKICLRRYPWLTEEYINENLWQICRLCNW